MVQSQIHNVRVQSITPLDSPAEYWKRYPASAEIESQVARHRAAIERIVAGDDPRLLVIVGPCSIHDPVAGIEYARRLATLADEVQDRVFVA